MKNKQSDRQDDKQTILPQRGPQQTQCNRRPKIIRHQAKGNPTTINNIQIYNNIESSYILSITEPNQLNWEADRNK